MADHITTSQIPLLQDLPFVAALLFLAAAMGYRILRLLRAPLGETTPLERGVLCAALGLGALQYLPYLLGMAGRLSPRTIAGGLVFLALAFSPDMLHVARSIWGRVRSGTGALPPLWIRAGIAMLCVILLVALFQTLCPPTEVDTLTYHFTAPKRWLQSG